MTTSQVPVLVLFAALAQAQTWTLLTPSGSAPPPRAWSSAAFDPVAQRMLIFGGQGSGPLSDTYALSTGANPTWSLIDQGGNGPRPRLGHSAAYDSRNSRLIIFGGGVGSPTPCVNDVWLLSNLSGGQGNPSWNPLQTTGPSPAVRMYHSAVYDPNTNRLIVFGGKDCSQNSAFFNDVWILSNIAAAGGGSVPTWTQLQITGAAPSAREGHTAVYDSSSNRMIIFGGDSNQGTWNDAWVLNNANGIGGVPTWSQVNASGVAPAPRTFAVAVWDTVGNRMIMNGGNSGTSNLGDTFSLSGFGSPSAQPSWTQLPITGSTPSKSAASAVFDPATNRMLVFAGNRSGATLNDVWALNLGQQQSQPVSITTTTVPNGQVGVGYSAQLAAINGTPPYSAWTVAGGSLPPGLTLNATTGLISGTPTSSSGSPFSFTVTVKDSTGTTSAPQAFTIAIPANAGVVISTSSLPNATVGVFYTQQLTAVGGTSPYGNWVIAGGFLPPGLTLNISTGVISGTPATTAGSPFTFSVTVKDNASGSSPAQTLSISVVSGITITPTNLPSGTSGVGYSVQLIASNGVPPYSNWTVSAGALPAGLTLNPASGVISGTPTAVTSGTFGFSVTVQDARNSISSPQAYLISIGTTVTISTTSLPLGSVSAPYSAQLNAAGGTPPYTNWTVVSGALPAGLALSPTSGAITGAPSAPGNFTFGVTVKDNPGSISPPQNFSLIVAPRVNITTTTVAGAFTGTAYSAPLAAADGVPPYSNWTIVSGALPTGLSLNAATGLISGTPGAGAITTSFSVTVKDSLGGTSLPQLVSIVVGPPPALSLAPSSFTFSYRLGDATPSPQSLSLFSGGAFTITTSSDQNFLVATPGSGQTPAAISLSINTNGLRTGTLNGVILIAPAASATTTSIPVTLTVDPAPAPQLQLSPPRFSINAVQGGSPAHLQLAVVNAGGGTLTFNARMTSTPSWASLDNASGAATSSAPGAVGIAIDPGALNPGTYQADVTVQDQASSQTQTCSVILSVTARPLSIQLSQSALQFNAIAGGSASPAQTIAVTSTGQGTAAWTSSVQVLSGPDGWLIATPAANGSAVAVSVDGSKLTPGQYFGSVRLNADGAANSPQVVMVATNVTNAAQSPSTAFSDVGALIVGDTTNLPISIANLSGRVLNYVSAAGTDDGRNWLGLSAATGSLAADRATAIGVQTSTAGLTAGVRRGTLRLSFADGSVRTVSITSVVPAANCTPQGLVAAITSLEPGFTVSAAAPVSLRVAIADTCGVPMTSGGVYVRFSDGSTGLALTHAGNGVWTGTWLPVNIDSPVGIMVTAFTGSAPPLSGQTSGLQGTIRSTNSPLPRVRNVFDAATPKPGDQVAVGSAAMLAGDGLSNATVRVADQLAPILSLNDAQAMAVIPRGIEPNTQQQLVLLNGPVMSVPLQITVADVAPGIFTVNQQGTGQGAIQFLNTTTLAAPAGDNAQPAQRGDIVSIFLTGLGAVTNAPPDGTPAPDGSSRTVATPVVVIGNAMANVSFSGLQPGIVGVYEVDAVVPDDAPSGDAVTVTVTMNGVTSNPVTMAIQ